MMRIRRRRSWRAIFPAPSRRESRCSTRATSVIPPNNTSKRSENLASGFSPHYVIVSIFQNDFGDMTDPASWAEGEYWLDRIVELCMHRGWQSLVVPAADEFALLGPRNYEPFQSQLSRIIKISSAKYVIRSFPLRTLCSGSGTMQHAQASPCETRSTICT